jgi:hypothetical protein
MMTNDQVVPTLNWERSARGLSHIHHNVGAGFEDDSDMWTLGEAQGIAQTIRGHPSKDESGKSSWKARARSKKAMNTSGRRVCVYMVH